MTVPRYRWTCVGRCGRAGSVCIGANARKNAIAAARRHWRHQHTEADTQANRRAYGPTVYRLYTDQQRTNEEVPWWNYPEPRRQA